MTRQEPFDCTDFFNNLATRIAAFEKKRKDLGKTEAFEFTAAAVYQPKETVLSRILAFFLDPHATHNQGDAFLSIFCETILEWPEDIVNERLAGRVVVRTEHRTDLLDEDRRIDVTIAFGHQFIVGIEVKVWAEDQPKQVHDYCEYMKNRCQGGKNFLCLYLTPYGKPPSEISLPDSRKWKSHLKLVSWRDDVHNLLDKFAAICEADIITAFINDVRKYLHYKFTGVPDMPMENEIKEYLASSRANQEAAIHVASHIGIVRKTLWDKVKQEIGEAIDGAVVADEYFGNDSLELVSISNPLGKWQLYFQQTNCGTFWKILHLNGDAKSLSSDDQNELKNRLGYKDINTQNADMSAPPECYAADWTESTLPWLDMLRQEPEAEHCVFVENIMRWYKEDASIVEAFLKEK